MNIRREECGKGIVVSWISGTEYCYHIEYDLFNTILKEDGFCSIPMRIDGMKGSKKNSVLVKNGGCYSEESGSSKMVIFYSIVQPYRIKHCSSNPDPFHSGISPTYTTESNVIHRM